jgi:hypothetical protein
MQVIHVIWVITSTLAHRNNEAQFSKFGRYKPQGPDKPQSNQANDSDAQGHIAYLLHDIDPGGGTTNIAVKAEM